MKPFSWIRPRKCWTAATVAGLGGADEVVVGDVEVGPGRGEPGRELVGPLERRDALLLGGPGHLLAVLVGAGQEEDVVTDQPVPAGQGVGVDRRVGVPHVGRVLDVVDRRGDEVAGHCPASVPTRGSPRHRTRCGPGRERRRYQLATWQPPRPVRSVYRWW